MQQWWFDDGLGLKSVICGVFFYNFSFILRFSIIFMNMQIKNLHLQPWDESKILTFNLGPSLVVQMMI